MKTIFVSIFLGISLFCFGQLDFEEHLITDFHTNNSRNFCSGDIDNDGDLDLIVSTINDPRIYWYENLDGLGDFSLAIPIPTEYNNNFTFTIILDDIDGDGDLDILASNDGNLVIWHENLDGLGDFSSENTISSTCNGAKSVYAGDLDGDGDLDVTTVSYDDNKVSWHENLDGLGNFSSEMIISSNLSGAMQVFIADIDNDGFNDVISRSTIDDRIAWYKNLDGLGDFGEQQNITFDGSASHAFAVDIDGDGDLDILGSFSNVFVKRIVWYENEDGLGSFSLRKLISTDNFVSVGLFHADVDGDGDIDAVTSPNGSISSNVEWYENEDGLGGLWNKRSFNNSSVNGRVKICADLNGDNNLDFIFSDGSNVAGWLDRNDNSDTAYHALPAPYPEEISSTNSSDLDGDGDMDVIVTSKKDNKISWYNNLNGHGSFSDLIEISTEIEEPNHTLVFDVDNDGDEDLIISSEVDSKIIWFENINGLGLFGEPNYISTTHAPNNLLKSDIDNDGDLDIVVSMFYNKIVWFENTENGFSLEKIISPNAVGGLKSIYLEDFNGDGNIDVLATINHRIVWYENLDGLGNFDTETIVFETMDNFSITCVYAKDIDLDGDQDIFFTYLNPGQVLWLENTDGSGSFGSPQILGENLYQPNYINITDLNGDGFLDIIVRCFTELAWFENLDGMLLFTEKKSILSTNHIAPALSDIDGNNIMDIITATNPDRLSWHENLSLASNAIYGRVFFDAQENGCTSNFYPTKNVPVSTLGTSEEFKTFSIISGYYQLYPPEGLFTTSVDLDYFNSSPISYTSNFSNLGNFELDKDFCLSPNQVINDLAIEIIPLSSPRIGSLVKFKIKVSNIGTTIMGGVTTIEFDNSKLEYLPLNSNITVGPSNVLTYEGPNQLGPLNSIDFIVSFMIKTPPEVNIGEIVSLTAEIETSVNDENNINNISFYKEEIVGAFDPNNIIVLEGNELLVSEIDRYLHYTINFQNTGSDYAEDIIIKNVLDENLDWSTFQLVSSSFNEMYVEIKNNTEIDFIFEDINLLDSTNYEELSHGHLSYKIKPKSNILVGEVIYNTADIYFDYNLPVETNIVETEIIEIISAQDIELANTKIQPNPATTELFIESDIKGLNIEIYNTLGKLVKKKDQSLSINLATLKPGLYYCKILNNEGRYIVKEFVKL